MVAEKGHSFLLLRMKATMEVGISLEWKSAMEFVCV